MRVACGSVVVLALLCGCAAPASSVAENSCRRYQRLVAWHRFQEAVFEYEYACANLEVSDKRHGDVLPEPSSDVLFRNVPVWMDVESLIALAEDTNLRLAPAAHDRLAFLLDKPPSTSTADLAKFYRDNPTRLWYEGSRTRRFRLLPEGTIRVGCSVAGSAGGVPGDDPLSVSQASYRRFVQLCRERRYREAGTEYQYGLRNFRHACARMGAPPVNAGSPQPLLRKLRDPDNVDHLVETARHVRDYPDLEELLRMCLSRHFKETELTLQEMVTSYASRD